jgi:protein dithiol oxidoreductase (disulfide-forming)
MTRSAVLIALLAVCVCACSRGASVQQKAPAASAPAAAVQPPADAPPPPQETAPVAQSETEQAANAQESDTDEDAQPTRGDTSLERVAALSPENQLPGGRWKPGINYDSIVPAQPTSVPAGKVEVMEVFWLGCPHCYALEPYIQKWLKSKPDYISFVRVPVMWGPVHQAHARLYYTLLELKRGDLVEKAFDTIQQTSNPLVANSDDATFSLDLAFATANGVKADDFTKAYRSMAVSTDLQRAQELTERYNITGVPTVVVDGKYSTDVGKAGSPDNLFVLIDDLAAAEHHH